MMNETKEERIRDNIDRNLYNINRQIQLLNIQKEDYLKRLDNLNKKDLFSKQEAKEIIEYLVNNIQQEQYSIEKFHVNTKSSSYHVKNMISQYTFLYLVKNDNKDISKKEIKEKYNIKEYNNECYIDSINNMKNTDISDNYVKLSVYNRYSDHDVKFNNKEENGIISINIEDEKFKYINDFINTLLEKKLTKKDIKLSNKEIKIIADNFILEYTNAKKLVKDIK